VSLDDLDYELPESLIAQSPISPRDAARLLIVSRSSTGPFEERVFRDLPECLAPDDLLVVNDTRVVPARLHARKPSGGGVELLLLERRPDASWTALMRGRAREGLVLELDGARAEILEVLGDGRIRVEFEKDGDIDDASLLAKLGEMPLPPYIRREAREADLDDYQTVFAEHEGAVAAPTASLHFTPELAARLRIARVTLHVGPGTFRPIRSDSLDEHVLESERFEVPEGTARAIRETKARGGAVIAVGTTVVRALETTRGEAGAGRTELFIRPGDAFSVIDQLITNFHLPRSTLLALVMAFGGTDCVRAAYRFAVEQGFRFYSYGDAMWLR
jgi:S-adenosylmethionine:tRNA ribosyltransferase-isomerase